MKQYLGIRSQSLASILSSPGNAKVVAVSTSAADTQNVRLTGSVGAETIALTGKVEKLGSRTWGVGETINRATLTAPAGSVKIMKLGTSGIGSLTFRDNPGASDYVRVGIGVIGDGLLRTYTFKHGEQSSVTTIANSGGGATLWTKYFDVYNGSSMYRVWYTSGSSTPPSAGGGTLVPVTIGAAETANSVATLTAAALNASVFIASAATNVVTIYATFLGNLTNISAGTSGMTVAVVTAGADNAGDVAIGQDKYQTARNLAEAINASGSVGNTYGTGTAVHAQCGAWADYAGTDSTLNGTSEVTVYLIDKIKCRRYLGWTLNVSTAGSVIDGVAPVGGENGATICEIAPGQVGAGVAFVLDSTDEINLSIGESYTFDAIQVGGRGCSLWVMGLASYGADVTFTVYGSPDGENYLSLGTLATSGSTLVQGSFFTGCEWIRVSVASPPADVGVMAALVY